MTLEWLRDIDAGALIDEAHHLAGMYRVAETRDESLEPYRARILPMEARCERLFALADEALDERGHAGSDEDAVEIESGERETAEDGVRAWFDRLSRAAAFARATGHPFGEAAPCWKPAPDRAPLAAWRDLLLALDRALASFEVEPVDWVAVGLDPGFPAMGCGLRQALVAEAEDVVRADAERRVSAERLHWLLDEIADLIIEICAMGDIVEANTGRRQPGMGLALARSARANGPWRRK